MSSLGNSSKKKKQINKQELHISHLSVEIEKKQIVHSVSLSIKPGETHVIMGPNGSGKSTLAQALAGHPSYSIVSGSVRLNELDLTQSSPDERSKNGLFLAFQYPVEIPGLKVQNFLRAVHEQHHGKLESVLEFYESLKQICTELGIKQSLLQRSLNDGFSGGEKKRVELLQMAVIKPKYAVMDETDSGLDIDAVKKVAEGINHVQKLHKTGLLIITHYQRILRYLTPDKVHIMVNGELVESGGPELAKAVEKKGYSKYVQVRTD